MRTAFRIAVLVLVSLQPAIAAPMHSTSLSRSTLRVAERSAELEVHSQAASWIEVLPLDADANGALSESELEAGRASMRDYLLAHDRVLAPQPSGADIPLAATFEGVRILPAVPTEADPMQWIALRVRFEADRPLDALIVESKLFVESGAMHRDLLRVFSPSDTEGQEFVFSDGLERISYEPAAARRGAVVLEFVRLGIEHILTGYDHLAFVLALLVASRRVRTLLGVITSFTLAHSITLGIAALRSAHGLGPLISPSFVEIAIALSIVYVASMNLLRRSARAPWLEAFCFGLIHGLGFAGFLGEALQGEPLIVSALFGFNCGVEIGQLGVVTLLVVALRLLPRGASDATSVRGSSGIAPRWFRLAASSVVVALGLFWVVQRAGWIDV